MSKRAKFEPELLFVVHVCGLGITPVLWFYASIALGWWFEPASYVFVSVVAVIAQVVACAAFYLGLAGRPQ